MDISQYLYLNVVGSQESAWLTPSSTLREIPSEVEVGYRPTQDEFSERPAPDWPQTAPDWVDPFAPDPDDHDTIYTASECSECSDILSADPESTDVLDPVLFEDPTGVLGHCSEASPSFVPWRPRLGNAKNRYALALQMREGVINRLPESRTPLPVHTSMSKVHVGQRIQELFGYTARQIQIDTVWTVGCQMISMILIAKTGIGKSLIFEAIPLLDPSRPGIVLVVMPLKKIQSQQVDKVNQINGARAVVYDGEHRDQMLRYRIAAGHYTHGKIRNPRSGFSNGSQSLLALN